MTNRIVYFFSLIFIFLILGSIFVFMRLSLEKTDVKVVSYISNNAEYVIEIQPEFIFKSGILPPLLDANLPQDDRIVFEPDKELIPSEPTGISFFSPFYIVIENQENLIVSLYFKINSPEDFTLFADKLNGKNPNIAAHSNSDVGIISYSTFVSQSEMLNQNKLLLKHPSRPDNKGTTNMLTSSTQKMNPISIYSCKNGEVAHTLKLTHNEDLSCFNFSGQLSYSNPSIVQKIVPNKNGFYFAIAFSDELKNFIKPLLSPYLSEAALENITGLELNYLGVELDHSIKRPAPKLNLHIHLKNTDSTLSLFSEIKRLHLIQTSDTTLVIAKNFHYNYSQSKGITSIYNTPFQLEDSLKTLVFKVEGEPSTIVKIQEPFGTIAFGFEPRLHVLKRLLTGMQYMSGEVQSTMDVLEINYETTYKQAVNPVFEMLFFLRKMNSHNKK